MSGQRRLELIRRGFTLVELVVVIVVLGGLAVTSMPILTRGFNTYFTGRDIMEADSQARVAMERITRELRTVRSTSDLTSIVPANQIQFNDRDGTAISYTLAAGNILNRNAQPLADNVTALSFTYLTNTGLAATTTAASVYYITVSLTMTRGVSVTTYRSTVLPWNF